MLEDNVTRLGVGLHDYYAISSCIGLLKKRTSNGPKSEEFEAADRVAKLMEKLLSLEDNYSAAATLASLPNMSVTATNNAITPHGQGNGQASGAESMELEHDFTQINNFDLEAQDWDFDTFFAFA
ncbi:MAG: hypothetical protein OHK93_006055 [Ramalina farinacea]|uniref:Uncharacterized protein n=1 Tax=Ramalina farinacea TaxID=258253 RepID=A0AA43QHS8_9LECA|nr:hypothetical protein [Ramalina farinacea]